jgi:hypothetical protein
LDSLPSLIVPIALLFPVFAFAQGTNGPVTRAQVLKHLSDLEGVGYRSSEASALRYPYDIEAAEARLAEKNREQAASETCKDSTESTRAVDP